MAALPLLVLCCASSTTAQTLGNVYYGKGPPAKTTYLVPPVTSPYNSPALAPAQAVAMAPGTVQSNNPPLDNETYVIGPCYCTPVRRSSNSNCAGWHSHLVCLKVVPSLQVVNDLTYCFLNETISVSENTTTTECDTPLAFQCQETEAAAGLYAQRPGVVFNCSTNTVSPAFAPTAFAPLPRLPAPSGTPVNSRDYTLVFQANGTSTDPGTGTPRQYAATPEIRAGQVSGPPEGLLHRKAHRCEVLDICMRNSGFAFEVSFRGVCGGADSEHQSAASQRRPAVCRGRYHHERPAERHPAGAAQPLHLRRQRLPHGGHQ